MNPFELRGPEFLLFYVLLAATALALALIARRTLGPSGAAGSHISDPYAIALLRGGAAEAVRVALLALHERGMLTRSGTMFTAVPEAETRTRDAFELEILRACGAGRSATVLLRSDALAAALAERRERLEDRGLAPDRELRRSLTKVLHVIIAIVIGVALIKLGVAAARGRGNVILLLFCSFIASIALIALRSNPPMATPRGRQLLRDLRDLFADARARGAQSGPEAIVLLAAVFGATALVGDGAQIMSMGRNQDSSSSGGCGSDAGSSTSGDSGGSGCGGSGCGGCGGGGD